MSLLCFPNLRWPAALPRAPKSIVINSICKKLLYFLCGYFGKYPGFGKFCCWLFRFVHLYQCRQTFNVVISCHLPADELDKIWKVWSFQTFHHDNIWLYKVQVLMQDHDITFWTLKGIMRSSIGIFSHEIVGESRPLIGIFSHTCWLVYWNAFLIMKLSNPPSFRAIRALIASQSMFEI